MEMFIHCAIQKKKNLLTKLKSFLIFETLQNTTWKQQISIAIQMQIQNSANQLNRLQNKRIC